MGSGSPGRQSLQHASGKRSCARPVPILAGAGVVFISGDHADAKADVEELATRMGFASIDLGSLEIGGYLQQFPGGPLPALNLVKLA